MEILNNIPLVGILLGFFIFLLILLSKGGQFKDNRIKICLLAIILLNVHIQFDSYLYYNGFDKWDIYGFSYLFVHLHGFLFFLYTIFLFKGKPKTKWWGIALIIYSVLRVIPALYLLEENEITEPFNWAEELIFLDYYISILINISLLLAAFLKLKRYKFAVQLEKHELTNFKWIKALVLASLIIYIANFQSSILIFFKEKEWLTFMKIETLIQSFFFFAVAFYAIKFPVFAIHGDFTDMEEKEVKKYAKSSLKESDSVDLWNLINQLMKEERLYTNPEYRLNDLAERVDKSLHHVSQVINEREGISFTDFINSFRIAEAKILLVSPKHENFTILAIAYEVGFNSKTTFYNAFKKQTGLTPTQFKKQA